MGKINRILTTNLLFDALWSAVGEKVKTTVLNA